MKTRTPLWAAAIALIGTACAAALTAHPRATADAAAPAVPPARAAARTGAPTFNKEIAPILIQNCASCHRPAEVAPFSLLSYQDAQKRAEQIALVTQNRTMPPWKADSHGEFRNERRLTDDQIRT